MRFTKFFEKFFLPLETELVLRKLDELEKEVRYTGAYSIVKSEAKKRIHSDPSINKTFRKSSKAPREIALQIILNISKEIMLSGENELYPNFVDALGEEMIKLNFRAATISANEGYITAVEWDDHKQWLLRLWKKNFHSLSDLVN